MYVSCTTSITKRTVYFKNNFCAILLFNMMLLIFRRFTLDLYLATYLVSCFECALCTLWRCIMLLFLKVHMLNSL